MYSDAPVDFELEASKAKSVKNANNQYLIEEVKEIEEYKLNINEDEETADTGNKESEQRKISSSSLEKSEVNNVENIYKRVFGN